VVTERALNTLAAAVTDWSEDKSKREALVQLGRSVLIKWLLSRALDDSNELQQAEAEHALLNLLADGELVYMDCSVTIAAGSSGLALARCLRTPGTSSCHCIASSFLAIQTLHDIAWQTCGFASMMNLLQCVGAATTASAVLNCEGALPKLLELLARTSDAEKLNSSLLTASAQVTLTQVPSLDEIKEVIDKVSTQALISLTCTPPALHHATISPELMCTNMMNVIQNQCSL